MEFGERRQPAVVAGRRRADVGPLTARLIRAHFVVPALEAQHAADAQALEEERQKHEDTHSQLLVLGEHFKQEEAREKELIEDAVAAERRQQDALRSELAAAQRAALMCGIERGSAVEKEELSELGLKLDKLTAGVGIVITQNSQKQESLDELKDLVTAKNEKLRGRASARADKERALAEFEVALDSCEPEPFARGGQGGCVRVHGRRHARSTRGPAGSGAKARRSAFGRARRASRARQPARRDPQ